ncbi:hypothetical protein B0H13DRAFT_2304391 [Mycena leptocephala]|nr:hypothetical protein B0H13DRAFT_2304391 [Mycena leptocephala]
MTAPSQPFDLKAVGKLFNDTLAIMRDETPSLDTLEPQAIEWLKRARHKLMRDIEAEYYELASTRHAPLSQPAWAVDPSKSLFLMTDRFPAVLEPFRSPIGSNLLALLSACGFNHLEGPLNGTHISFHLYFPALLTSETRPPKPRVLLVEDDFSDFERGAHDRTRNGGAFTASDFGRLLIDARGESARGDGGADSGGEGPSGVRNGNEGRGDDSDP